MPASEYCAECAAEALRLYILADLYEEDGARATAKERRAMARAILAKVSA
jgi:hypothetical protein